METKAVKFQHFTLQLLKRPSFKRFGLHGDVLLSDTFKETIHAKFILQKYNSENAEN